MLGTNAVSIQFARTGTPIRQTRTPTIRRTYDVCDRPTRKSDPDGLIIEYAYDAAGNLVSRVSPSQFFPRRDVPAVRMMMTDVSEWRSFLHDWDREFKSLLAKAGREAIERHYVWCLQFMSGSNLFCAGADAAQVEQASLRLGLHFPADYVAFLRASNGLFVPGVVAEGVRLLPVAEIGLYRVLHQEQYQIWVDTGAPWPECVPDDEYFVYGDHQHSDVIRRDLLDRVIAISDQL